MSLELFNPTTLISRKYSRQFMEKAFELARFNGWQPMGTRPPAEHDFHLLNADWLGIYLTNDGQSVSFEDALSLASRNASRKNVTLVKRCIKKKCYREIFQSLAVFWSI